MREPVTTTSCSDWPDWASAVPAGRMAAAAPIPSAPAMKSRSGLGRSDPLELRRAEVFIVVLPQETVPMPRRAGPARVCIILRAGRRHFFA
jgi:hypothetical protein